MRRYRYFLLGLALLSVALAAASFRRSVQYYNSSPARVWAVGLERGRLGAGFRRLTPQTSRSFPRGLRVREFPAGFRWWFDWSSAPGSLMIVVPVWPAALILGGLAVAGFRARSPSPTACPRCGYELAMAPGPRCPECGAEREA